MKVLMINTVNLEANGISTFIINSAKELAKMGINITILAPNKIRKKLAIELLQNNIHLKEIENRNSNPLKYFLQLKKYLSCQNFDIVHVNGNSTTMAIELFAARLAGIKIRIAHSHNTTTEHAIINHVLRPLFEFNVNGRLACNKAAGKWLFRNKNFTVIQNGINLSSYRFNFKKRERIRSELHIKKNEVLLGHVGEFNYQKNQTFLINLMRKLPSLYKLVLIGEGENLYKVKSEVNKYKLNNRIIFTGVINNVSDYLSAIDIFLLPSKFEGQPFVLIEATASGLNCIASNKVSRETNLVENIKYIPLTQTNRWIHDIRKLNFKYRDRNTIKYINKLQIKGYDLKHNTEQLIKFYKELYV